MRFIGRKGAGAICCTASLPTCGSRGVTAARFDQLFADIDAYNPPSSSGLTLREVIERYEDDPARRGLTGKTRQAYGTVFRALRELLGENKRVRDITRDGCRRVQDILCSLRPKASKRLPGRTLEQAALTAKCPSGNYRIDR